ncbi:MAG: cobalamin-dependent protein [Deltaproteobacteria bacterium]|jgi:5-methyltetrahydrofolate--homocysteine methyltransferase|nr:cobalamin-dependent protein [Deltaproteobacteria bacterium]
MLKIQADRLGLVNLIQSLISLEVGESLSITQTLSDRNMPPKCILTACEAAMVEISDLYDTGEYFIAALIMAGEIMNRVIKLVSPRMPDKLFLENRYKGRVVIGTVKGEIHCLGKNIAGALLAANGFEVKDLGSDVSTEEFMETVREWKPDVVGLSVLLTCCFHSMEETVRAIRNERKEGPGPQILISGAQVNNAIKDCFHADYYAATVFDTVRLCESLCRSKSAQAA